MAETLATIAATVAGMLTRTDLTAEIKKEIRSTVAHYVRMGGDFLQRGEGEITTVANQQWYATVDFSGSFGAESSPSATLGVADILLIEHMKIAPGSSGYDDSIVPVDFDTFERLSNGADTGQDPEYYCIHAERIGFWPIPDSIMTIEVAGLIRPAPVTLDAGTTPMFDRFTELVECATAKRICQKYIFDYQRAQAFAAMEAEIWGPIASDMRRRLSTGRLRPTEM